MDNSNFPLVSIITPSWNQGEFLEETIKSILRQDYPNMEYIIVDGASSDGSVEIIKKYEHKLKWWVSEPDKGQTDAILKGLEYADGEFFTWICSDDLIEPSMISISVAFMLKYPRAGITFGDRIRIDQKGNILGVSFYSFRKYYLKMGLTLPQETCLIRRETYDKSGGLDRNLRMAMDFDLWCKINRIADIKHIPAILGRFRSHSNNKSSIFSNQLENPVNNKDFIKEYSRVFESHFNKKPPFRMLKFNKILRKFHYYTDKYRSNYRLGKNLIDKIRQK